MKEFNYIIIGGGCAGLSLAYELEINDKLKDKTLAIIEPRDEYKRDKTWSFWRVSDHNFDDCIKKSWTNFTINTRDHTKHIDCKNTPYETIDSELFYKKILKSLKKNPNIEFYKNINQISFGNSLIFNSLNNLSEYKHNLWQHFSGIEIETDRDFFDEEVFNLMDFDCDQRERVHFFYTLPFSKNKALIETTWISDLTDESIKDYDNQLKDYLKNYLKLINYKVIFKETGAIPLFYPKKDKKINQIEIGSAGGMTRLSTGYTFLNIQNHCKYIRENIENIKNIKNFEIQSKYRFLDNIFLKVLKKNPTKMPKIFYKMFNCAPETVINFLSNKSNFKEDFEIITKMPKWIFLRQLF